MIFYLEENRIFVLETENTHYVFGIDSAGYNRHLHCMPSVTRRIMLLRRSVTKTPIIPCWTNTDRS